MKSSCCRYRRGTILAAFIVATHATHAPAQRGIEYDWVKERVETGREEMCRTIAGFAYALPAADVPFPDSERSFGDRIRIYGDFLHVLDRHCTWPVGTEMEDTVEGARQHLCVALTFMGGLLSMDNAELRQVLHGADKLSATYASDLVGTIDEILGLQDRYCTSGR